MSIDNYWGLNFLFTYVQPLLRITHINIVLALANLAIEWLSLPLEILCQEKAKNTRSTPVKLKPTVAENSVKMNLFWIPHYILRLIEQPANPKTACVFCCFTWRKFAARHLRFIGWPCSGHCGVRAYLNKRKSTSNHFSTYLA